MTTSHFSEALANLREVRSVNGLAHLGTSQNLESALDLALNANREAIKTELNVLRGNARVGIAAMWVGLALLALGILLVYMRKLEVGIASGAIGLFSEVIPLIVFRRLQQSREEIRRRLPNYATLYAVVVALEVSNPEARSEVLKVLQGAKESST